MASKEFGTSRSRIVLVLCTLIFTLSPIQLQAIVSGTQLWAKRYDGPSYGDDGARALAVDANGNVFVAGYSRSNDDPFTVLKYDHAGNRKWVKNYVGPGQRQGIAESIAVDRNGNVYVTGMHYGEAYRSDYATIKYDSAGNQKWLRRYDGPGSREDGACCIAVDATGNVYVTGHSESYSPDGYSSGTDYLTIKYDSAGNRKWARRYNGLDNLSDRPNSLTVDAAGNVYVTGESNSYDSEGYYYNEDYLTIKYDSVGNQKWVRSYNGPGDFADYARSIAVDAGGNVYVTGGSYSDSTYMDFATIKYDSAGNQKWVKRYIGDSGSEAESLAVESL